MEALSYDGFLVHIEGEDQAFNDKDATVNRLLELVLYCIFGWLRVLELCKALGL